MKRNWLSTLLLLCIFITTGLFAAEVDNAPSLRIQPWDENPRYWQYNGNPILLLGGSDEDNLFNDPALLEDNLAKMKACGANYIRSTLSIRDPNNVTPYEMVNGKYDLDEWNPEYWRRLEDSIQKCHAQDAIVQIEVWATFDHYREYWLKHPFNPALNNDVTQENSKLLPEWDHHPASKPQPFFFSIPKINNDKVLLGYQENFVRKVLDVTLPYPNVLYCLDNETRAPVEWAHYWGEFIHNEAKQRGITVQLTEMWDAWDVTSEEHERTYKHPEYFNYCDVSQNNWQEGQTHYDRLIWYRDMLAGQPGGIRPMNNVKVYHRLGGGRPNDPVIGIERWWRNVFAGCASTRFHRPDSGLGISDDAQSAIHAARTFFNQFDIFHAEPKPALLTDRQENEAYCLATSTHAYALYFPKGGDVRLPVDGNASEYQIRWFDPKKAIFLDLNRSTDGSEVVLKSPDEKQIWLVLIERIQE